MQKKLSSKGRYARYGLPALMLRAMRIALFLTLACVMNLHATGYSQDTRLTLNLKNVKLSQVFSIIQQRTDYQFLYNDEDVHKAPPVSLSVKDATIPQILAICFKDYPLSYSVVNKTVVVLPRVDQFTGQPASLKTTVPPFVVSGRVTDESGNPMIGVSVTLKGTSIGTITDTKGGYSLTLPEGAGMLVFSYIGVKTQQIAINGRHEINVKLEAVASALNQVVVTALGVRQEKKTLSYITQSVNTDQLTEARDLNVMNALEGKVAGLNISQSGSGIGAPSRVTLRGNRSISGDSQPLYVVDGVPTLGYPEGLDPDNFASINVLKGANAAALYGSDAQNGAIIITTKKGNPGEVHVSLNNTFMLSQADLGIDFQNQYGQGTAGVYQKGAISSWGPQMDGRTVASWTLNPARAAETYPFSPQPNNVMDLFQTGRTLSSNLQASIGGDKVQTFFSATSTEASGVLPNNNLQRNNLSVRMTGELSNKFSLDAKISYTRQGTDNPTRQSDNNFNPMQQIYLMPRNIRTQDAMKFEYTDPQGLVQQDYWSPGTASTAENPYWVLNRNISNDKMERLTGLASLTYNFTDALNVMVRAAYDRINDNFEQKDYNGTLVRALYGRYTVTQSNNYELNTDFLFSYTKKLTGDWSLDAHAGGNIKQLGNGTLSSNTGPAMLVPNFFSMSNTNFPQTSYDPGAPSEIQSLYAFGKLGWRNAVFLDLTGRNDWSSTLPSNNRSYFYPSAGLSVVISDLIPSLPKAISFAKARASLARVGSSPAPFMLQRTATFSSGGTNGFLSLNNVLPNTNLKPEQTKSFETGFNIQFFGGRLGLDATYFKENTVNQLFTIALPVGSGASSFYTNGGNIQNKGVELILNTVPVETKNFRWTFDVNFSHLKNTVISISDDRPKVIIGNGTDQYFADYVVQQGLAFGDMFTVGFARDSLGRVIVGTNGVPRLSNQRNFNIGSYTPDWTGSISSSFSYKSISLSFVIDHRQGGIVGSFTQANLVYDGLTKETLQGRDGGLIFGQNFFSGYKAVQADGTPNTVPVNAQTFWQSIGNPSVPVGELFAENATNTRLRELVIGYTLPQSFVKRLHVANVKVSLVGRNLFFISRATPGLDPDMLTGTGTSAEGFSSFPPPTTRSFGVNLKIDFK